MSNTCEISACIDVQLEPVTCLSVILEPVTCLDMCIQGEGLGLAVCDIRFVDYFQQQTCQLEIIDLQINGLTVTVITSGSTQTTFYRFLATDGSVLQDWSGSNEFTADEIGQYLVQVQDVFGCKDFEFFEIEFVPPPDAPESFLATVDHPDVSFAWDVVADVDGYNVYINDGSGFEKHNETLIETNSYEILGMDTGEYSAYVTAVKDDQESDPSNVDEFLINIWFTDFEEYVVGQQPNDWNRVNHDGWTVELFTGSTGKALQFTGSTSGQHFLRWEIPPIHTDIVIEARVLATTKGGNTRMRLLARTGTNITAYFSELTGFSSDQLTLWGVINDSFNNLGALTTPVWSANNWYRMKIEVIGTTVRTKYWLDGNTEPGWMISNTDSQINDGKPGVSMRVNSASDKYYCDWIKVTKLD